MSNTTTSFYQLSSTEVYIDQANFIRTTPALFPGIPEHQRCRYASKPCGNLRTTKRGGGLHRFCEHHRARANETQWRVDQRRRLERIRDGDLVINPVSRSRARSPRSPDSSDSEWKLSQMSPTEIVLGGDECGLLSGGMSMSPEELDILSHLLLSDDDEDLTR